MLRIICFYVINYTEFYGASVLEVNEKTMVLNINNVAVLFSAIENENIRKSNGELLFEKCGFDKYYKTVKNFFIDNYKESIWDGNLQCIDMYYYYMDLTKIGE